MFLRSRRRAHRALSPPAQLGTEDGLSYAVFLPPGEPRGRVVVLHGADSVKENHFDYARAAAAYGFASAVFDQRGHGASSGALGDGTPQDVAAIAALLPGGPLALRGSSMGGYFALVSAEAVGAAAVVAICPAPAEGLLRGVRSGMFEFRCDRAALEGFLEQHDDVEAARELRGALLLMHAEGDEVVPIEHSRALLEAAGCERRRLIEMAGGDHRSVQHDGELQGESLRFLERALLR